MARRQKRPKPRFLRSLRMRETGQRGYRDNIDLLGSIMINNYIHVHPRPKYDLALQHAYLEHMTLTWRRRSHCLFTTVGMKRKIPLYIEWYNNRLDDPETARNRPYKRIKNM